MRIVALIGAIVLASFGFSEEKTYILQPEGTFYSSQTTMHGTPIGNWRVSGCEFTKFHISEKQTNGQLNPMATVEKPKTWSRGYQLKMGGKRYASFYSQPWSWGSLFDSAKEFFLYDAEENIIGRISGSFFSSQPAEFYFYDKQDVLFAKAILDPSWSELTIQSLEEEPFIICKKTFEVKNSWVHFDTPDYFWRIKKLLSDRFDSRFLWPFVSFISEVWWSGVTKYKPEFEIRVNPALKDGE